MSITLKELAELSGCSIRTVSRALRGNGPIASDKRERINEIARRYHYAPNMAARNLKTDRRSCIGVITNVSYFEGGAFSRKLNDFTARLEKLNMYPLLGRYSSGCGDLNSVLRDWAGLADCVFFFTPSAEDCSEIMECADRFAFRFTVVDPACDLPDSISVLQIDRASGIVDGVRTLAKQGHRRFLRVGNIFTRDAGWEKATGICSDAQFSHLQEPSERIQCMKLGELIMKQHADAVFFDTDRGAAGFLQYALKNGIQIPKELAVVGFDDEPFCDKLFPTLSSIAHPVDELNCAAVEIALGNTSAQKQIFPTRFVLRESVSAHHQVL